MSNVYRCKTCSLSFISLKIMRTSQQVEGLHLIGFAKASTLSFIDNAMQLKILSSSKVPQCRRICLSSFDVYAVGMHHILSCFLGTFLH